MTRETETKISYINFCITQFAKRFRMQPQVAYRYLNEYKGLAFLDECYAAEHLVSASDAVTDLRQVCRRHGGTL